MGDTKRMRKKYQTPSQPWELARLEEERPLIKEYGLVNKKELWKMGSLAKGMAIQAKNLIASRADEQADKEKELLLKRVVRYNLIGQADPIESVLALNAKDILERRLQTQVFRKNLAKTMKQARQLITHKHIMVNDQVVTSPSYILTSEEETQIGYASNSPLIVETHPERADVQVQKEIAEEKEKIENSAKKEAEEEFVESQAPSEELAEKVKQEEKPAEVPKEEKVEEKKEDESEKSKA